MTTLFGASVACAINDMQQSISPVRKAYKSLERQGRLIKMRNSLIHELERIEDMDVSEARELDLKFIALRAYLCLTSRTLRKEEIYAARCAKRRGDLAPAFALAKRYAEIQDILEEYFF